MSREAALRAERKYYAKNKTKRDEQSRARNKDKRREYSREYYAKNKDTMNENKREWAAKNKERHTEYKRAYVVKYNLQKKYGLTLADYDTLLATQKGVCAICQEPCGSGNRLAVDHCHSIGKVRGLLCVGCNTGLGSFGDSPLRLQAAISYLLKD